MNTYTYTYNIVAYVYHQDGNREVILSGEVQASRWSFACVRAWEAINVECERIEHDSGGKVAVGTLDMRISA
jgi:hypothetical protein